MLIRKKVEWDGNTTYVDFGMNINTDNLEVAKVALVLFMLVALNSH